MNEVPVESSVLDVLKHTIQSKISEHEIVSAREPQLLMRREAHNLVTALTVWFAGQKPPYPTATLSVSYPATWWQHLKQSWFPKFMLKRWPVILTTKTEVHTFDVTVVYDKIKVPSHSHNIRVTVQKSVPFFKETKENV